MNHNDFKEYKPTLKASTFAIRTSQRTDQKLQKSLLCQHTKNRHGMTTNTTEKKGEVLTSVLQNGGFSASYDSFVVGSSAVLRLNICAENPPLRKAEKRCQFSLQSTVYKLLPQLIKK